MRNTGWTVSFYLASRAIRRGNRGTLALTILIIALVVVLLNFLTMIVGGVTAAYNQQTIDYEYGHLTIEPRDKMTVIPDADALVDRIKRVPGVTGVTSRFSTGVTLVNPRNGKFISWSLGSFNPDDERTVTRFHDHLISGEFLSKGDTDKILLGIEVAGNDDESRDKVATLGGVKVGDTVKVAFSNGVVKDYKVKGIFETEGLLVDMSSFITRDEMDEVMHTDGMATTVLVRGNNGNDADGAMAMKYAVMQYGVQEPVKTWHEKGKGIMEDTIGSVDLLNYLMTLVSLVVASVVIFIITFINVINRKKQIAILKAIGIRPKIIVNSYLIQVLFLCTCGGITGAIFLYSIDLILTVHQLKFPVGYILPVINTFDVILSIAGLYIVGLISGYVPARHVANEEILDAMRG